VISRTPFVVLLSLVAAATPVSWAATSAPASATAHVWQAAAGDSWPGHGTDPANPQACDPIDPAQCMLPYPNDWFTKPDPSSATGRRLDLTVAMMPHNVNGKPIEPQEFNRSDGFSAGAQILTVVPGMTKNDDLVPSGLPPVTDLGMNESPDLGVVLLDTQTGEKSPVWTEIDQYTSESGPFAPGQIGSLQQDLIIHPAVNLIDGHRYIVALRHLHTDDGSLAQPNAAFKAYRDGTAPSNDPRTAHMNEIFDTLAQAGVGRSDLYLAWDFTTASTLNVTGRLLAIRDDAFKQLGDTHLDDGIIEGNAPTFTVDNVDNNPGGSLERRISGHFTVPCYIAPTCDPPTKCDTVSQGIVNDCPTPGQFLLDPTNPDATPTQVPGQTYQANFICNVGKAAYEGHQLMRPVEYGHGLFGSADEVNSGPQQTMTADHGMMYCATDWTGMATADVPNAVAALQDMSRFPWLTDRVQQGELNFLYLARLMVHPQGFASNAAFQWTDGSSYDGKSFIDLSRGLKSQAYYDGNSQGGIYGGTVCAISVDISHCVLGVPGMDYSILLPRSSDYVATHTVTDTSALDPSSPTDSVGYSELFDSSYPDQSQRLLVLGLAQTLWDRSDPNGYATHMTSNPLPNTPAHEVLLQLAYGDHQVANITAETEARTIGASGFAPPLEADRYGPYKDPFWGIPSVTGGATNGSAIAIFDSGPVRDIQPGQNQGTDWPPTSDTPNRSGEDPHEAPRRAPCGQQQKDLFLQPSGLAVATCSGAPYGSWDFTPGAGPVLPESSKPVLLAVSALLALATLSVSRVRRRARRLAPR
jgi:hypothetical protein